MGCASGECSSVERKTRAGWLVMTGARSVFTTDCTIVRAEVFSRTARRMGLGLSGREKSGAFAPAKTMNNGTMTVNKRMQRLCFTDILIKATYQTLCCNTSRLNREQRISPFKRALVNHNMIVIQASCIGRRMPLVTPDAFTENLSVIRSWSTCARFSPQACRRRRSRRS